jgi:hypothetical protein
MVREKDLDAAWKILDPVDDLDDDDERFQGFTPHNWENDGSHPEDCPLEFWN